MAFTQGYSVYLIYRGNPIEVGGKEVEMCRLTKLREGLTFLVRFKVCLIRAPEELGWSGSSVGRAMD